jgi:hypothetical protein
LIYIRGQRFARQANKGNQQNKGNGQQSPSPISYQPSPPSQLPSVPPVPHSPALSAAMSLDSQPPSDAQTPTSRKPPFFFREEYAGLIVKGNFMTLAAKPKLVDEGEWLAHQGNFNFNYFTHLKQYTS